MQLGELSTKISVLEKQLEGAEGRETQVRANNKVRPRLIRLCYLSDLYPDTARRTPESAVICSTTGAAT
jgi:hypothetical protein